MRKNPVSLVALLLILASSAAAETRTVVLEGARAEHKWTLKELNSDLPADWSGYRYLVLEFRAASPQRFQLRLYTADGVRNAGINPFPGAWVRAALPLGIFQQQSREGMDMASVANRSRPSYFLNLNGPYGPLTAVEAIGIVMQTPLGKPSVRTALGAARQGIAGRRRVGGEAAGGRVRPVDGLRPQIARGTAARMGA